MKRKTLKKKKTHHKRQKASILFCCKADCEREPRKVFTLMCAHTLLIRLIIRNKHRGYCVEYRKKHFLQRQKKMRHDSFRGMNDIRASITRQKDIYLFFIDYVKPFDSVRHKVLFELLGKLIFIWKRYCTRNKPLRLKTN